MGIPDRIILTLYTFLMTVVSVFLILCSLNVFPQRVIIAFIESIPGSWWYAVGGVIMLSVSIRLLFAGIGVTGDNSLKISEGPNGKVHVGKTAIENYIAKLEDEGIYVRINASIEPGINIPETTGEIKVNVRDSIKKVTGIDVKDIEIFFKQIKSKEE